MVSMIVSSVNGESQNAWKRATRKIFKRVQPSDYKENGSLRLWQMSINSLDDLQRHDAFAILSDLGKRNLLNLASNSRGNTTASYGNTSELYFSQRHELQNLALNLGHQDNLFNRERLLIERKHNSLVGKCKLVNERAFDTKVLSIQSGPTEENHDNDMNFSETEALLLFFTSTEYVLLTFLKSMKKLKFLMVSNCGTKKATLKGIDVLSFLNQLKSLRLERVTSPFVEKQSIEAVQNLEKLSLSLCEGFGNISIFDTTKLKDFSLDHCSDLGELPLEICSMSLALSLSITNCHLLQKLPDCFGNVSHVRMLKLSALPFLKELSESIGKLGHLEYLDISACEGLKELPKEIGKRRNLREL